MIDKTKAFEAFKLAQQGNYQFYFPNKWEGDTQLFIELTLIQQWLRNDYHTYLVVLPYTTYPVKSRVFIWMFVGKISSTAMQKTFESYEEALIDGLIETFKILKQ